jgi:hypothetical protein
MKKTLKRFVRNSLFLVRRLVGLEKLLVLQGEMRANQINLSGRLQDLADAEFSVFSQWGEDGIINWLINTTGLSNKKFVEFGVEDYRESNTRFLLMSRYWSGLVIDGSSDNIKSIKGDDIAYKYDLQTTQAFITADNINDLLLQAGFSGELGLLSVDIDGVDYWVLKSITNKCGIIIVEYNQLFGEHCVTVPYDASFRRLEKHPSGIYWGASLAAFRYLLEPQGYVFVGTNRAGTNAFFVSESLEPKVREQLSAYKEWECKMREARDISGALAFKRYDEVRDSVAHLPVVELKSGRTISIGDLEGAVVEDAGHRSL